MTVVGILIGSKSEDRFLNPNIFTKNGTEIEYDTWRDSSSFAGAFGQSADATYVLSSHATEDLVGESETDLDITVRTKILILMFKLRICCKFNKTRMARIQ